MSDVPHMIPATTTALIEAAEATEHPLPTEPPPDLAIERGWKIESLEDVDWALSRIRDLKAEQMENHQLWRRAERRIAAMNEQAERGVAFFEAHILYWLARERAAVLKGGRKKSRNLINGTVGFRSSGGGLEMVDEDALLAWALTQDPSLGLVRVKMEPAMAAIKEYAAQHQLIPPGMREAEKQDEPYVKPDLTGLVLATRKEST